VDTTISSALTDEECRYAAENRVEFALGYYRHLMRLREYVVLHLHEPFGMSEVASEIGVSASWLSHLFQKKTGITFSDWVRHERVQCSMNLLRVSDRSVCETAIAAGFRNSRTFERAFKKATGLTPSEYRRSVLRQHLPEERVRNRYRPPLVSNFATIDNLSDMRSE
jgi:transcriptional regulator GlxA family with amidase domain